MLFVSLDRVDTVTALKLPHRIIHCNLKFESGVNLNLITASGSLCQWTVQNIPTTGTASGISIGPLGFSSTIQESISK